MSFSSVSSEVKAWVNFNGTSTVSIRASLNVSSITDNGTGTYDINFTTALADANYATVAMTQEDTGGGGRGIAGQGTPTASVRSVHTFNLGNVLQDHQFITVGFLR